MVTVSPVNERGELVTVEEKIELVSSGGFFRSKTVAKSSV